MLHVTCHRLVEQILEKLFESVPKVRLLKLFTRNPEEHFTSKELIRKTQVSGAQVKRELAWFVKLGLLKTKIEGLKYEIKKKSRSRRKRGSPVAARKRPPKILTKIRKERVYYANSEFKLLEELKALMVKASVVNKGKLLGQIKGLGGVKLCVVSGVFLNGNNSRTDLLVVGSIKKKKLGAFLAKIESEIGKQLRYTVMDTDEFKYRMNMYDRFLRDILEEPHEKLINKLNL